MLITENLFVLLGKATCDFANLRQITTASDVENLFSWASLSLAADPDAPAIYTREQQQLRQLLDGLIALDGDVRQAVDFRQQQLRPIVIENRTAPARHRAFGELHFGEQGFELEIPPQGTHGVKTSWLLFFDAALTPERNRRYLHSRRVAKCKRNDCPTPYFIRRPVRPKLFCSRACKKKVNG